MNYFKNMKAAGIDEITNEDIKQIEQIKPGLILTVLNKIWVEEKCPFEFRQPVIHLVPKPHKPGNTQRWTIPDKKSPYTTPSHFEKTLWDDPVESYHEARNTKPIPIWMPLRMFDSGLPIYA